MTTRTRPARPDEAGALSELALRSKAYWGYDDDFLEACRAELTVDPNECDGVHVIVAADGEALAGFAHVTGSAGDAGELDALFVDPPHIGTGVGRLLLAAAVDTARRLGVTELGIDADPGAEAFYLRQGAERVGETPSGSVPGRVLPRLRLGTR